MTKADPRVLAFLGVPGRRADELALGDTAKVIELPKRHRPPPAVVPDASQAFERAWATYAALDGLRRSTRRLSWPQWVIVARVHGEAALEAAVSAWASDPQARQQASRTGAPGFQVWLRQGRWENWLGVQAGAASPPATESVAPKRFPDDPLRDSFRARFRDERAHRWFDRCGWDEEEREIVFPNQALKQEWVEGPFRNWMTANDVRAIRWS